MYPSEIFDKFKETAVTVYSFTAKFVGLLVKNPLATGAAGVSILTALSVLCRWLLNCSTQKEEMKTAARNESWLWWRHALAHGGASRTWELC